MSSMRPYLFFGLALLGLLGWTLLHRMPTQAPTSTSGPAPEFHVETIIGDAPVSLASTQGKVRLLVFWATWCGPCRAEIPTLIHLQETLGSQGLQVIGVSVDEDHSQIKALHDQVHFNYPILAASSQMLTDYGGISSIPTLFLINRNGDLIEMIPGMIDDSQLEHEVEVALK
jgi:thiol-disulfide isomerase/thioredoxin